MAGGKEMASVPCASMKEALHGSSATCNGRGQIFKVGQIVCKAQRLVHACACAYLHTLNALPTDKKKERARERKRGRERERERVCVCERERESVRESVCVYVCFYMYVCLCMCMCVCVCLCVCCL